VALLAQRPDIQTKAIEAIWEFYTDEEPLCDPLDDQKYAYIAAMVREFFRYCVLRLALPRAMVKDVNYEGKLIPAGSTIYLNAVSCTFLYFSAFHTNESYSNPKIWADSEIFRPEQWLE